MLRRLTRSALLLATLTAAAVAGPVPAALAQADPNQGPGGPILVVTGSDGFGRYYPEILRAEGLNEFAVGNLGALNAQTLSAYQVVVLGPTTLSPAQAAVLSGWVNAGGNLIAMRPDADLAGLLGLGSPAGTLANGYLAVAQQGPGAGIVADTMQFHGTADRWTLNGATAVASLFSNASTPAGQPAVTLKSVGGAGGQAAAFTYDLAQSVVLTRQGNPAWAGTDRDGNDSAVRSNDLFFPDWVDPAKVHIPQADEQQRLLANLITQMSADGTPLPRFWYLPRGLPAAVVMTGDDHGRNTPGGSKEQFDAFDVASPAGCSVADWTCVRGTTYIYPEVGLAGATGYQAQGHEIALHFRTEPDCAKEDDSTLRSLWAAQFAAFVNAFPGIAAPVTNRTHCIAWSGWVNDAIIEREKGIRLDTNYYYWPEDWMPAPGTNYPRPGVFTGSGFPQRFANTDGSLVDVYQATTQVTDEWSSSQSAAVGVAPAITALLDRATGPLGFYGVFTANMHTDEMNTPHPGAASIIWAAQQKGIPVVSARQMLGWLDGRNASSFGAVRAAGGRLDFTINVAAGAQGLTAMVPVNGPTGRLQAILRDGAAVSSTFQTIKGVEYAVFPAVPGNYIAAYPGAQLQGTPPVAQQPPARRPDHTRPRVVVKNRKLRLRADGRIALKIACPRSEIRCKVDVKLRNAKRKKLARAGAVIAGGKTVKVRLHLPRAVRRQLVRRGALALNVRIVARDAAGNKRESTTEIRVLAPRRR